MALLCGTYRPDPFWAVLEASVSGKKHVSEAANERYMGRWTHSMGGGAFHGMPACPVCLDEGQVITPSESP